MVRRQSCCNNLRKVTELDDEKEEPELIAISELGVNK